ncbi:DUF4159 domain-containing protein [Urechidicola vernalis]|uniref:DUF4159 domain-containing protein n=1 Tax=Urechidicola vernalis TaxID=3075600 RepID=A0ABU2Y7Z0_9FLAO|nr:DUF4159 domain-containing protein [Urechidicola sp. P050]MDT0554318.1 DUF4159 domain-containing protein [Urechidicola sp. P050]
MKRFILIFSILFSSSTVGQELATLKYDGGGDWYSNPTALPNLIQYCNNNIQTKISSNQTSVEVESIDLFNYPLVFMTGHGNVYFSDFAIENLRNYLTSGGFLHISDNYGLDPYIRKEMKKVFPNAEFEEIPNNHPIYHQSYSFDKGIPKIHEHDNKPAQGFGIFIDGRLVCFYDFETDLSDGWEDASVHNNPESTREKALQMGANIVQYAFSN